MRVSHDEGMTPTDFPCHGSKVKVILECFVFAAVRGDAMLCIALLKWLGAQKT